MLTSMSFDGTSSGRKCYGAGRRRFSFGSFQLSGLRSNGTSFRAGFFLKKPIREAWERLKGSRSCERFFVDISLEQADLGFLSRY